MLKYAFAGALVAGFSASAAAQAIDNPWEGDGAEVNIEIDVNAIGEVWSAVGTNQARNGAPPLALGIDNAGGFLATNGVAWDTVYHFANTDYEISANIDTNVGDDIPEWTRFHIIFGVTNRSGYNAVGGNLAGQTNATAETIVTYDRRDSGTGYIGTLPNIPVLVTSHAASTSAIPSLVDYAADSVHGLPPQTATPAAVVVVYTIAEQ